MSRAGDQDRLEVHIKHKSYRNAAGGELQVLGAVSIAVASGEVAALIGPSGCGKTTLLRIIVGLDSDFEGTVRLPAHGRLGVVFRSALRHTAAGFALGRAGNALHRLNGRVRFRPGPHIGAHGACVGF